jgi:long-chain acyl-CoA synthetase
MRAKDRQSAALRASHVWAEWPQITDALGSRVQLLLGDVASPRLGLNENQYLHLCTSLTHIVHSAGDLRLDGPLDELRRTNVTGTSRVIELAEAVQQDHGLARLAHVSTAYVAGTRKGQISEDSFTDKYGFTCNYERSKYEGEALVQGIRGKLPFSIFRPAQIVGDAQTNLKTLFGIYFMVRAYLNIRPRVIP